jgi:hypothetical protein
MVPGRQMMRALLLLLGALPGAPAPSFCCRPRSAATKIGTQNGCGYAIEWSRIEPGNTLLSSATCTMAAAPTGRSTWLSIVACLIQPLGRVLRRAGTAAAARNADGSGGLPAA